MTTDIEASNGMVVPYHLGIIMDGNGRWAQERGLPRLEGHRAGTENLRIVIRACVEFGIKILTIYAFSTENWSRPVAEVRGLLRIFDNAIDRELNELHENGVQLRHIGRMRGMTPAMRKKVLQAIDLTKDNDRLILNVAFDYGGRTELVEAVQKIVREGVPADEITEDLISRYLYTSGQRDPDLIIRTSGELRVSNFLIWQGAYSEYFVTSTYWPDFNREKLQEALEAYAIRNRRYGGLAK